MTPEERAAAIINCKPADVPEQFRGITDAVAAAIREAVPALAAEVRRLRATLGVIRQDGAERGLLREELWLGLLLDAALDGSAACPHCGRAESDPPMCCDRAISDHGTRQQVMEGPAPC